MVTSRALQKFGGSLNKVLHGMLRTPLSSKALDLNISPHARGTVYEKWGAAFIKKGLKRQGFDLDVSYSETSGHKARSIFEDIKQKVGKDALLNIPGKQRYDARLLDRPTLIMQPFGKTQGTIDAALLAFGTIFLISIKSYTSGYAIKHNSAPIHLAVLYVYLRKSGTDGHYIYHGSLLRKAIQRDLVHAQMTRQSDTFIRKAINGAQSPIMENKRRDDRTMHLLRLKEYCRREHGLGNAWDVCTHSIGAAMNGGWRALKPLSEFALLELRERAAKEELADIKRQKAALKRTIKAPRKIA
jgi:hypothetical protein